MIRHTAVNFGVTTFIFALCQVFPRPTSSTAREARQPPARFFIDCPVGRRLTFRHDPGHPPAHDRPSDFCQQPRRRRPGTRDCAQVIERLQGAFAAHVRWYPIFGSTNRCSPTQGLHGKHSCAGGLDIFVCLLWSRLGSGCIRGTGRKMAASSTRALSASLRCSRSGAGSRTRTAARLTGHAGLHNGRNSIRRTRRR